MCHLLLFVKTTSCRLVGFTHSEVVVGVVRYLQLRGRPFWTRQGQRWPYYTVLCVGDGQSSNRPVSLEASRPLFGLTMLSLV